MPTPHDVCYVLLPEEGDRVTHAECCARQKKGEDAWVAAKLQ